MDKPVSDASSSNIDSWTWIMLGILLLLGLVIGVGALALTNLTTQNQVPTGSQTVPGR
jgi:hypothetical protein